MSERFDMDPTTVHLTFVEQQVVPAELLDDLKLRLHEQSKTEGRIMDLGTLNGGQNEHLWNQGEKTISLKRRLESGEVSVTDVQEAYTAVAEYYVPTTPGAAKRCVDGSTGQGYDDNDPRAFVRAIGPQIQGGSGDEAVAQRLIKGFSADDSEVTLLDDLRNVAANRPNPSRFAEGGHTDDSVNADVVADAEKTGCGAVDGQPRKAPRYAEPEAAAVISGTAAAVYGLAELQPAEEAFTLLQSRVAELAERPGYFRCKPNDIVKVLQQLNSQGVEKVVRPHNEVGVVINFVSDTTLHRDHFNARTDSNIQMFGLDAWNIVEEYGVEHGYALVADAVATLMDLTDGSLRLLARVPTQKDMALAG